MPQTFTAIPGRTNGDDVDAGWFNILRLAGVAVEGVVATKADQTALAAHVAATSVHGVTGAVVGTTDAQTLSSKTLSDPLTFTEVSSPSAPATTKRKLYTKSDGKFYHMGPDGVETAVGSGSGGGGGLNFLTLDSGYASLNQNDADFEAGLGRWTVYADAAGTAPVDMTGGAPVSTVVRATVSPLNGAANAFWDLGTGASLQGEGVVLGPVYVPPGYRGRTVQLSMVWAATGALVENDLIPYAYDITNSALIQPFQASKILGAQGKMVATISIPTTCAQLRVGIHCARTTTTALSLKFDDVKLSDEATPMGLAGGNTRSGLAFTASNFGTVVTPRYTSSQSGDVLTVKGNFIAGTPTAFSASIDFPAGLSIKPGVLSSTGGGQIVGKIWRTAGIGFASTAAGPWPLFYDGSNGGSLFYSLASYQGTLSPSGGNAGFGAGDGVQFDFSVPIAQYDANVSMAESSTFKISSYLANGTRVVGVAPQNLGEYRSYLRNASALTYTEASAAPTSAPSASNGMQVWAGNGWATADTASSPSYYEIFVGKNKNVSYQFYSAVVRTGTFLPNQVYADGFSTGLDTGYDPSTGIVTVINRVLSSNATGQYVGRSSAGLLSSGYFDITVSQNALGVGVQAPRSQVKVVGVYAYGSAGGNKIICLNTVITNIGSAISYVSDSVNGDTFTINEDGVYSGVGRAARSNGGNDVGVTKNSTQLTTSVDTSTDANILGYGNGPYANASGVATWSSFLPAGTVLRLHGDGNPLYTGVSKQGEMQITKVSN